MYLHQVLRLSLGVMPDQKLHLFFSSRSPPNPLRTIKNTECGNNITEYMEIFFTLKAISGLEVKQKQLNLASNIFPPSHLLSSF